MTPLQMATDFMSRMGQKLNQKWYMDFALEDFRFSLIAEEYAEAWEESATGTDPTNMLKELADLQYVINGYCATYGWDLDEAYRRVHVSNMSKLDDDGHPIKNEAGKVIKGPNYKPCDLSDLV